MLNAIKVDAESVRCWGLTLDDKYQSWMLSAIKSDVG